MDSSIGGAKNQGPRGETRQRKRGGAPGYKGTPSQEKKRGVGCSQTKKIMVKAQRNEHQKKDQSGKKSLKIKKKIEVKEGLGGLMREKKQMKGYRGKKKRRTDWAPNSKKRSRLVFNRYQRKWMLEFGTLVLAVNRPKQREKNKGKTKGDKTSVQKGKYPGLKRKGPGGRGKQKKKR